MTHPKEIYISEEYFNSIIEKWKEEEKIWKQELEEKDKEIERLKEELDLLNTQHPKNKPMSNKKQTAVEFAVEKLAKFIPSGNQLVIRIILEQAKELEKHQIEDAYFCGKDNTPSMTEEQYYKETYEQ